MRHRLDLWVLHSLFTSHFFGSAATVASQSAKAARELRASPVTLARRDEPLRALVYHCGSAFLDNRPSRGT